MQKLGKRNNLFMVLTVKKEKSGACTAVSKNTMCFRMFFIFSLFLFLAFSAGSKICTYADTTDENISAEIEESKEVDEQTDGMVKSEDDSSVNEMEKVLTGDSKTGSAFHKLGKKFLEKLIYYIPFVGVGIFLIGAGISAASLINKGNRRWGIRMAVLTSIGLFIAYILLILLYDSQFIGIKPTEVVRPEVLDHYGMVYFNVLDKVLDAQRLSGLADKVLSRDIFSVLVKFYEESAFDIGIVVFGFGLLVSIIMKRSPIVKRWARIVLCVIVPIVLYAGYRYIMGLDI